MNLPSKFLKQKSLVKLQQKTADMRELDLYIHQKKHLYNLTTNQYRIYGFT